MRKNWRCGKNCSSKNEQKMGCGILNRKMCRKNWSERKYLRSEDKLKSTDLQEKIRTRKKMKKKLLESAKKILGLRFSMSNFSQKMGGKNLCK